MQKILYAIQQKAAEDMITQSIAQHGIVPAGGTAAYREAVVPSLKESSADILVYRETLKGSLDTFDLMYQVRKEFPDVRIVFIANFQSITSPLLCKLVFLGIYDIINSDHPNVADITDFIINPRGFGYANKFFRPENIEAMLPQLPEPVVPEPEGKGKKGLFGLLDKISGGSGVSTAPVSAPSAYPEAPKVDLETMRSAMLEESRRVAQAEIPQLVQIQVDAATATLTVELQEKTQEITNLSQNIRNQKSEISVLKKQLEEAVQLRKNAEERMAELRRESDLTVQNYQAQLTSLQTVKPPEWYQEQTNKWLAERASWKSKVDTMTETIAGLNETIVGLNEKLKAAAVEMETLKGQLASKTAEVEALQLAVPRTVSVDEALDDDFVIIPDDDTQLKTTTNGEGRLIAFMGTKHGVGNTTVALNTAIALANCGYKTCFIELNRHFPMVNEFFEFSNIVRGLDTAIKAVQQNNPALASQCIIKPHGVITPKKSLSKIYSRLPGPLHFLLYSNSFLLQCKAGTAPYISERELKDLAYFLTVQERYSYVIIDLQPDDQESIATFLASSYHVHQLVLTLTQDPHSITTAGYMITSLARGKSGGLLRNAEFVLNHYAASNKMKQNKICDFLHIPPARLSKISLDNDGYMNACYSMVPYLLSKGRYSQEYIDLRMKLTS